MADSDIGNITPNQMEIKLQDKVPVQLNYHSVPKPQYAELRANIENFYKKGWIINSSSSYSSPVASVRQMDDLLPLCCDNRHLNRKTIPDRDPQPKIKNILENLRRSQYFSILDQAKWNHQIHLSPESRYLTAFITSWSFYEWIRLPFGLMNALTVFQRFMEQIFLDHRDHFVVPYPDDLFVFSSDFSSHLKHLQLTLQRLRKYGVKIQEEKCQLFRK